MNLLAGIYYDPSVAVTKATTALLAMTVVDNVNLRNTFTGPPSGRVKVIIRGGCIHGATTFPQMLVGCIEASPSAGTVRGRQSPQGGGFNGTALATTHMPVAVEYVQSVTPGQAYTWDLAYGVEILLAATGWKYGGPNDTTTNNAFGGISFEIWDPSPIYTPASGAAPTTTVSARIDTIDDFLDTEIAAIKAKTDNLPADPADASDVMAAAAAIQADTDNIQTRLPAALVGGRMDVSVGAMAADVVTASAIAAGAITSSEAPALANLDAAVTSRMASYTQPAGFLAATFPSDPADASDVMAAAAAIQADTDNIQTRLPAALVSGRMASIAEVVSDKTGYSLTAAPLDAAGIRAALGFASANFDTQIATLLPTSGYTAPNNAAIVAIKAKTDSLGFTAAGYLDANVLKINGVTITGDGSTTPFGV